MHGGRGTQWALRVRHLQAPGLLAAFTSLDMLPGAVGLPAAAAVAGAGLLVSDSLHGTKWHDDLDEMARRCL